MSTKSGQAQRAEFDKKGKEWVIPYPPELMESVQALRKALDAVEGLVFAGERLPGQPMDRHLFDKWLTYAEREEKLPKLKGGLWHPYRRKWATERKHWPVTDVAAAGGWTDTDTLLKCYTHPDRTTLLKVTGETRKVTEQGIEQ